MAKGLRASRKKANKTRLRLSVYETVEKARNERLSAKLLGLAAEPKPSRDADIDMESANTEQLKEAKKTSNEAKAVEESEAMLIDQPGSSKQHGSTNQKKSPRIQKRRKYKSIVFPVGYKHYKPNTQKRKR